MSLMNKTITVDFDIDGTTEAATKAIANGIYTIIKDIYIDSSIEENTVYLDKDKQYSMQIKIGTTNTYPVIRFNNQDNYLESTYQVSTILAEKNKAITYAISKEKTMVAFGIGTDKLNLAIGYQEEIGYFFLKMGEIGNSYISPFTNILLKNTMVQKYQTTINSAIGGTCTRWVCSNSSTNKTFINLPLFVQAGIFKELYELISCYINENINYNNIIYSNNKYYKLLTLSTIESSTNSSGKYNTTILAMEVADD